MINSAEQLEAALSGPLPAGSVMRSYGRAIADHGLWADAMRMAAAGGRTGPQAHTAFHAGWALEHAYFHAPDDFAPFVGRFLDDFISVRNPSVHRHYTKIMYDLLLRGAAQPTAAQQEAITGRCFDFLIDPAVRVGVKAWAMDVLALLAPKVEWIAEHLRAVVERQMAEGTPGMVSRGRRLLRRLGNT